MEGAKRLGPIKIWKQVTEVMLFAFDSRETDATNEERLSMDTAKASAFSVNVRHNIKATIILVNISMAA